MLHSPSKPLRPALLAAALALAFASRAAPGPANGERSLPEPAERTEHFLLELARPDAPPADGVPARAVAPAAALAQWTRRRTEAGWQLELELLFPEEGIRVYAVECLSARGPRLVWREVSAGAGRTVLAEWTAGAAELRALEWGSDGSLREECDASGGAVMPLYLAELLRLGRLSQGDWLVFDPLARALERQWVRTSYAADEQGGGFERTVELLREDASLAARYVFRGEELVRFEWQEGGWSARRIDAAEYARLTHSGGAPPSLASEPAHEAVKDL